MLASKPTALASTPDCDEQMEYKIRAKLNKSGGAMWFHIHIENVCKVEGFLFLEHQMDRKLNPPGSNSHLAIFQCLKCFASHADAMPKGSRVGRKEFKKNGG